MLEELRTTIKRTTPKQRLTNIPRLKSLPNDSVSVDDLLEVYFKRQIKREEVDYSKRRSRDRHNQCHCKGTE